MIEKYHSARKFLIESNSKISLIEGEFLNIDKVTRSHMGKHDNKCENYGNFVCHFRCLYLHRF